MVNRFGSGGLAVLALLMVVSFQNCGKQFDHLHTFSSSQCRAQMKEQIAQQKIPAQQLQCSNFANYACERRIFSPDVQDMTHTLTECVPGGEPCVDVDIRQYNTSVARVGATPDQFAPGGDYNHEELHCWNRTLIKGIIAFEGGGDSLEEALAAAVAACEKAEAP